MSLPIIGFALVTYRDPQQTQDLIAVLNAVFDHPPISIHHDPRLCSLDSGTWSPNVKAIPEKFTTGWGTMETVLAMCASIRHVMMAPQRPDWFCLITSHCMPIVKGDVAKNFLANTSYDLFIRQAQVFPKIDASHWARVMRDRYVKSTVPRNLLSKLWHKIDKLASTPDPDNVGPFSSKFPCRAGGTYFTGNRKVLLALEDGLRDSGLIRWLSRREIADECFFATVLGNNQGLRIAETDLRYIKWSDQPNPDSLTMEDFFAISSSGMHYARKLAPGVSDELREKIKSELLGVL